MFMAVPTTTAQAQFGMRMRRDHERFRAIVKTAGLTPE